MQRAAQDAAESRSSSSTRLGEPVHDTPSVGATNWNGGVAATRHLLALGHRRIGIITGPKEILCSRARLDGYRAAMDAADVRDRSRAHPVRRLPCANRASSWARSMLRLPDPPTAIFAANDLMALGIYQAAREARLHIPEDLSVVGFDDLPVAGWVRSAADDDSPATCRDGTERDAAGPRHRTGRRCRARHGSSSRPSSCCARARRRLRAERLCVAGTVTRRHRTGSGFE